MTEKVKNFYAYEFAFTRIKKVKKEDRFQFLTDYNALKEILMRCKTEKIVDVRQIYSGNWFLAIEDVQELEVEDKDDAEIYLAGRFVTGEYGRIGNLRNADTMNTRKNDKKKREGEERFIYFAIRKSDSLLFLQGDM